MQALTSPSHEPSARRATMMDWLAEPEERRAELVGGRIVYKAAPDFDHGETQGNLRAQLDPFVRRPRDAEQPGGWWLGVEVDVELGADGVRPDIAGWRRDRHPARPKRRPGGAVIERPDWVAEVLSPSTAARDLGEKLAIYHRAGIDHYWVIDPRNRTLSVYRWTKDGYVIAVAAGVGAKVRVEPFEPMELEVSLLFGEEDDDRPREPPSSP
jgi:Uma2 family endonuclease